MNPAGVGRTACALHRLENSKLWGIGSEVPPAGQNGTPMLMLYYAPGSSSMASHIALEEAGATYETLQLRMQPGDGVRWQGFTGAAAEAEADEGMGGVGGHGEF